MQTQTFTITVSGQSPCELDVSLSGSRRSLGCESIVEPVRCALIADARDMLAGKLVRILADSYIAAGSDGDRVTLIVFGEHVSTMDCCEWPAAVAKIVDEEFPPAGMVAS